MTALHVGDTAPAFTATCTDDGVGANCAGAANPVIHFDRPGIDVPLIRTGTWVDAAAGKVKYDWALDGTEVSVAGDWHALVHVTFANNRLQTFGPASFPVGPHHSH